MWYTKWWKDTYTLKSHMYDQIILEYKSYIRENSRFWQPQMEYGYYPVKCMYLNGILQCQPPFEVGLMCTTMFNSRICITAMYCYAV